MTLLLWLGAAAAVVGAWLLSQYAYDTVLWGALSVPAFVSGPFNTLTAIFLAPMSAVALLIVTAVLVLRRRADGRLVTPGRVAIAALGVPYALSVSALLAGGEAALHWLLTPFALPVVLMYQVPLLVTLMRLQGNRHGGLSRALAVAAFSVALALLAFMLVWAMVAGGTD